MNYKRMQLRPRSMNQFIEFETIYHSFEFPNSMQQSPLIQILFAELADLIADVQRQISDRMRPQARAPTYIKQVFVILLQPLFRSTKSKVGIEIQGRTNVV